MKKYRALQKGSHHVAIVVVAVVALLSLLGFVGYNSWQRQVSNAGSESMLGRGVTSVSTTTKVGCELGGRKWTNNECAKNCVGGATFRSIGTKKGYCVGYVATNITQEKCSSNLRRIWISNLGDSEIGCARRVDQKNTKGASQCQSLYPNYVANGNTDYCEAFSQANPAPTVPSNPTTPNPTTTSYPSNSADCSLAGRKWSNNKCSTTCSTGSYRAVSKAKSGYCTGSIDTNQSESECTKTLHRKYVKTLGCAKLSTFANRFDHSNLGYAADVKQCATGYRVYYQNTRDFCAKGPSSSVSLKRDTTKPSVLTATDAMRVSGEWESIDPRTGYSFSQQSTYWQKSRKIAKDIYEAKMVGDKNRKIIVGKCQYTVGQLSSLEKCLKAQTNGNLYGVWRWVNEDSSDNLFNSYSPNKKFLKIYTLHYSYGGDFFHAKIGYNPNYFSSKAEQDSWVKRNGVIVTPTEYTDTASTPKKKASIVIGSGHTYSSSYKFKYSDGKSPGYAGASYSTKGTSPFKSNRALK